MKNQLERYLSENEVIIERQSGFREKHSCETAINLVIANWKSSAIKGKIVLAVFVDLKRAFETIDRDRLTKKLWNIGIRGKENEWFRNYLQRRMQKTKFGEEILVEIGVPQGSTLACVLFSIYMNDIGSILEYCDIDLFADDTLISIEAQTIEEAESKMNDDLKKLDKWLKINKLKINTEKTKYMVIARSQQTCNINISGNPIEKVTEMKYLGITIDDKLNFKKHAEQVTRKLAKKIHFICRINRFLTKQTKLIIYNTIVKPQIEYCPSVLFLLKKSEIKKLQKMQNKAMRLLLACDRKTHVKTMLDKLDFLSVRQNIYLNVMCLLFKMKNNLLPKYLINKTKLVGDMQNRNLRNINDFRPPQCRSEMARNSIFFEGVLQYNNLPDNVKNAMNLNDFKKLCKIHAKTKPM